MIRRNFNQQVIAVTGASGNLGTAFCERFGKEGARIIAIDLHQEGIDELKERLKSQGIPVWGKACDITDKESCLKTLEEGKAFFGGIDVLINNAGITHIERYRKMDKSKDIVRKVMEVNFFGAVNCTEACLDEIVLRKGMIISISSVAGFAPLIGRTAYSASKHALHGFFESLRAELAPTGVQCMMVCPSFIKAAEERPDQHNSENNSIYQPKKVLGKATSPDMIAEEVYQAAVNNKPMIVAGSVGKQSYWLHRLSPNLYERIMRNRLKDEG